MAMGLGLSSWILCEVFEPSAIWPPQLIGLLMSIIGIIIGSLLPNIISKPLPEEDEHAYLHHHAASQTEHIPTHPHHHQDLH
jgi:hypothetical protein